MILFFTLSPFLFPSPTPIFGLLVERSLFIAGRRESFLRYRVLLTLLQLLFYCIFFHFLLPEPATVPPPWFGAFPLLVCFPTNSRIILSFRKHPLFQFFCILLSHGHFRRLFFRLRGPLPRALLRLAELFMLTLSTFTTFFLT